MFSKKFNLPFNSRVNHLMKLSWRIFPKDGKTDSFLSSPLTVVIFLSFFLPSSFISSPFLSFFLSVFASHCRNFPSFLSSPFAIVFFSRNFLFTQTLAWLSIGIPRTIIIIIFYLYKRQCLRQQKTATTRAIFWEGIF